MPDLTPQIEDLATDGVQSASVDGRSVTAVPLDQLIEADKYLKSLEAVEDPSPSGGPKSAWRGLRMGRAIPPGAGPQ